MNKILLIGALLIVLFLLWKRKQAKKQSATGNGNTGGDVTSASGTQGPTGSTPVTPRQSDAPVIVIDGGSSLIEVDWPDLLPEGSVMVD